MITKIKYKLILSIAIIAILPALPLSYLFQNMMEKFFSLGLNQRTELALVDAVEISRSIIQKEKKNSLKNTRQFIETPQVIAFMRIYGSRSLRGADIELLSSLNLVEKNKLDGLILFDASLQELFLNSAFTSNNDILRSLRDTAFARERIQTNSEYVDYREREHLLIAGIPIVMPNQQKGVVLSVTLMNSEFYQKSENILNTLQFYRSFSTESESIKKSFFYAFLTIYFILIVFSLAIGVFFASIMTKPIRILAVGTEQISKGNLDYQIKIRPRRDEIGQLMLSFNQMAQNIRQEQDRVLYLEKMSTWREIAQRLAHEIKNPLTPIQLTVQQIKDSYRGEDAKYKKTLEECYSIIEEEILSLRNLTKEFSEFARMPSLSLKPVSLNQIIRDVATFYASVSFKLELQENLPTAELDAEAVKRVIINLFDNALAATTGNPNRLITVTTASIDSFIRLIVSDNGDGIPKENLSKIFEPHFSTKSSSMGLGLAIVKSIIEEHKAQISVDSVENLGTTFTIDFRIKAPTIFDNE
jgi:nitrogen fixation/metabolism regulation signal transduction histidine kinase